MVEEGALDANPLTAADLYEDVAYLADAGFGLLYE